MSSSPVVGTREVAYRVFAAEFDDASLSYSESDEERAPNYVVTPTGARLNRTFVAGALTEVEHVNDEVLRGRIADPTGAFVTYAGQYQPEPMAFLEQATPPAFVALAGKARTYEPDDADVVYTSIRPESINTIDADVRDRWLVTAAEATLNRIAVFDEALSMPQRGDELGRHLEARGVDATLAAGIPRAIDHYGTTRAYLEALRTLAVQALELVAGERDQVDNLTVSPGDDGDATLGPLPELDLLPADSVDVEPVAETAEPDEPTADAEAETAETADADQPEVSAEAESESADTDSETTVESDPVTAEATTAGSTETKSSSETADAVVDDPVESPAADVETADGDAGAEQPLESEPELEPESEPESEPEPEPESEPESEPEPEPESEPEPTFSDDAADTDADTDSVDSATSGSLGDFDDDAPETASSDDEEGELGDFDDDLSAFDAEADEASDADTATADTDADAADSSGMYEMDEEERAEIESEFGTEFTSGSDVDPAGEADIDVPDVDEISEQMDDDVSEADDEPAEVDDEPTGTDADDADDAEPAGDVDLESVVVETMEELDDGDGADHDDVVAAVVDEYGADVDAVEDAIQDALLGGRCYEPQDDVLKAI